MNNMSESNNISRQLYLEWIPQIVYNHHQSGPAGTIVAGPPYRDPFNYVYDPAIVTGLDAIGSAMNGRLNIEGKPGYTQRTGSVFSTWWNGGLRTTTYFHNQLGLLTEVVGSPTPMEIPLVPTRLVPKLRQSLPRHAAEMALPPTHRLLRLAQLRRPRLRRPPARPPALQHLAHGPKLHRARQPRHVDPLPAPHRSHQGRPPPRQSPRRPRHRFRRTHPLLHRQNNRRMPRNTTTR
jgi:hypothetical protein